MISISEPLIDGPFGTLIERIIEWMDEYYSIRLSGEVIRGMKEKALKHGYQSTPCLGYDAVGGGRPFVINENEYRIVQYIMDQYDLYDQDATAIARKCNDLGFRSKRGNLFEQRNVDLILKNPFYAGTVVWNGISFEGSHETRLPKERFEKRIALMRARRRPAKARNISTCKHWLSGLLRCSVCGATLSLAGSGSYSRSPLRKQKLQSVITLTGFSPELISRILFGTSPIRKKVMSWICSGRNWIRSP